MLSILSILNTTSSTAIPPADQHAQTRLGGGREQYGGGRAEVVVAFKRGGDEYEHVVRVPVGGGLQGMMMFFLFYLRGLGYGCGGGCEVLSAF